MSRVHVDFAGPFMNMYYFILVDAYTCWPEIHIVKDMTARNTITLLRKIFASFGLPRVLVSDNTKTFVCYEFKRFLQENGIIYKLSAPYHPATNGLAERYVQTFKQTLRALRGSEPELQNQLSKFLLHYRKTPHSVTGISPAYLMFNRDIRTRLDFLTEGRDLISSGVQKGSCNGVPEFKLGQRVECRDYIHKDKWMFGKIHKRLGKIHYLVKLDNSQIWERHVEQIREIGEEVPSERPIISNSSALQAYLENDLTPQTTASPEPIVESVLHENEDKGFASPIGSKIELVQRTSCLPEVTRGELRRSKRNIRAPVRLDL